MGICDDGLEENTLSVRYNHIRVKVHECQNVVVISDSMLSGMPLPEVANSNRIYPTVRRPISSAPECSYVEHMLSLGDNSYWSIMNTNPGAMK